MLRGIHFLYSFFANENHECLMSSLINRERPALTPSCFRVMEFFNEQGIHIL